MLFPKRDYSANRTLLTCFLLALVPMGAGANAGSSPTGAAMPAPLIAQLAEDENVEDVVQSEPRRNKAKLSENAPDEAEAPAQLPAEETPKPVTAELIKPRQVRSEEHTSELQSRPHLVCRL